MAWFTTDEGKHVNTDWFDEDEKRKYRQLEQNQQEAAKKNSEEKESWRDKDSIIERNEDGEILFKASVKDIDTGKIRTSFEFSAYDLEQAKNDLHKNGYKIHSNSLLPKKLYDRVMKETNGYKWDWEDAQKEFKAALKEEKRQASKNKPLEPGKPTKVSDEAFKYIFRNAKKLARDGRTDVDMIAGGFNYKGDDTPVLSLQALRGIQARINSQKSEIQLDVELGVISKEEGKMEMQALEIVQRTLNDKAANRRR